MTHPQKTHVATSATETRYLTAQEAERFLDNRCPLEWQLRKIGE